MRWLPVLLLTSVTTACVPTTKFNYVPVNEANFIAAQNGEKIPLIWDSTALCFPDGTTAFIQEAKWTETGICGYAHSGDDGYECYGPGDLAGIGIPYEGRSVSVVPMASVQIGECDPEALAQ